MRLRFLAAALACLAITLAGDAQAPRSSGRNRPQSPSAAPAPAPPRPAAIRLDKQDIPGPTGRLNVDITEVLGHNLPSRVELQTPKFAGPVVFDLPEGKAPLDVPVGAYTAYVYVYTLGVPALVEVKKITVQKGEEQFLLVDLLEGSGAGRPLLDFDQDCDFAIDRAEIAAGTDPHDAASIPGRKTLPAHTRVLEKKEGWYRGELHAHSTYGIGKETVAQLVARAERMGLDFLAITDRNTLAASEDPAFKSDRVVLLPALEWGNEERGVALIYGPRTFPDLVDTMAQAQAIVDLVQAQGGFYAIAHPCFPTAPWQWGLGYVNGIEVWCREWNGVPPLSPERLNEDMLERIKGKYRHSIAFAAASAFAGAAALGSDTGVMSANGQATVFYDAELVRGLKAAVIAGSSTASPDVPMAAPVTYVYAVDKSVPGILDGLRRGRTYVSSGLDGPRIQFTADVLNDKKPDIPVGGIVPLGVPTAFGVLVENAMGKDLQILHNGRPLISKRIENNAFVLRFEDTPMNYSVYRVRVVGKPARAGFGPVEVYAMSSPIYAQSLNIKDPTIEAIKKQNMEQTTVPGPTAPLPSSPGPGEIQPKWRF